MQCEFCDKKIEDGKEVTIGSGEHFHEPCYKTSMNDKLRMQPLSDQE